MIYNEIADNVLFFCYRLGGEEMSKRTKGEGTIRKRSDGIWEGRYVNCIGETKYIYGKNKNEVRNKQKNVIYDYHTNAINHQEIRGDITLNLWFKHYIKIKQQMIKSQSINQIVLAFKNHISPIIGEILMCEINANDIINLINSLDTKDISEASKVTVLRHTKAMFKFATEEGVIKKSPFLYVKINDTGSTKCRRILTNTEIEHLFTIARTTDYQFYLMICTLLFTGIRVGELWGLKWNDFNEDFSSIRIDESLTNKKFENTTKTRYSMRVVPLTEFLKYEYIEFYRYKNQPNINEYAYLNRRGTPFETQHIDSKFRYLKTCVSQYYPDDDFSNITPHCLRHTFTTQGLKAGVSIKEIQELLGHASATTTLQIYTHVDYVDYIEKQRSISLIESYTNAPIKREADSNDKQLKEKWFNTTRYGSKKNSKMLNNA